MRATLARPRVEGGEIVVAAVLLLGVLAIARGWFLAERPALVAGLAVTLAGVMLGVVRLVVRRGR